MFFNIRKDIFRPKMRGEITPGVNVTELEKGVEFEELSVNLTIHSDIM